MLSEVTRSSYAVTNQLSFPQLLKTTVSFRQLTDTFNPYILIPISVNPKDVLILDALTEGPIVALDNFVEESEAHNEHKVMLTDTRASC